MFLATVLQKKLTKACTSYYNFSEVCKKKKGKKPAILKVYISVMADSIWNGKFLILRKFP